MPYALALLAMLALAVMPGLWVRAQLGRYSRVPARAGLTGRQVAERLLRDAAIVGVTVEAHPVSDHYDPLARAVRLTPDKLEGTSLTAVAVAAHEVGHAVQHALGWPPFGLRTSLALLARQAMLARLALVLAVPALGLVTRSPLVALGAGFVAVAAFLLPVLVHLATLPVELDASFARALPSLRARNLVTTEEEPHVQAILRAAAWTYVAGALGSLLAMGRRQPL